MKQGCSADPQVLGSEVGRQTHPVEGHGQEVPCGDGETPEVGREVQHHAQRRRARHGVADVRQREQDAHAAQGNARRVGLLLLQVIGQEDHGLGHDQHPHDHGHEDGEEDVDRAAGEGELEVGGVHVCVGEVVLSGDSCLVICKEEDFVLGGWAGVGRRRAEEANVCIAHCEIEVQVAGGGSRSGGGGAGLGDDGDAVCAIDIRLNTVGVDGVLQNRSAVEWEACSVLIHVVVGRRGSQTE